MADEVESAAGGAASVFTRKLGPLPVWAWGVAVAAVYLLVVKRKGAAGTVGGSTDPAGNSGAIDPATGYVYGSSQDTSALGAQSSAGSSGTVSGSGGSTIAGQYATNDQWQRAAINFLVGLGIDPTEANNAIGTFLASQPLTSAQQADVNIAIQSLGAPPTPPQPGNSSGPIAQPSPGTTYATNPVTGLSTTNLTSNAVTVVWSKSTNAQGYTVNYSGGSSGSTTVSGTAGSATLGGLKAGSQYTVSVQATPAKSGDPSASTSFTTPGSSSTSGSGAKTITVSAAEAALGPSAGLKAVATRAGHPGSEVSLYDANAGAINSIAAGMGAEASQTVERTKYGQTHHLSGEFFPIKSGMVLQLPKGW